MAKQDKKISLGEKFDDEAHFAEKPSEYEENLRSVLIALAINLEATSEAPDNDFSPQYKIRREEPRVEPNDLSDKNHDHWDDPGSLRKIGFLSVSRHGVSHDFPVRFAHPTGLSKLMSHFNPSGECPVIFVTGLDGKEHAFHVQDDRRNYHEDTGLKSTQKIADFIATELAKAAPARHRSPRPSVEASA